MTSDAVERPEDEDRRDELDRDEPEEDRRLSP
jgi:hypothetical protein